MESLTQVTSFLSQSFYISAFTNASTVLTQEVLEQSKSDSSFSNPEKAIVLASYILAFGIAYIAISTFAACLIKQRRPLSQNSVIVHLQRHERLQVIDTFLNEQV